MRYFIYGLFLFMIIGVTGVSAIPTAAQIQNPDFEESSIGTFPSSWATYDPNAGSGYNITVVGTVGSYTPRAGSQQVEIEWTNGQEIHLAQNLTGFDANPQVTFKIWAVSPDGAYVWSYIKWFGVSDNQLAINRTDMYFAPSSYSELSLSVSNTNDPAKIEVGIAIYMSRRTPGASWHIYLDNATIEGDGFVAEFNIPTITILVPTFILIAGVIIRKRKKTIQGHSHSISKIVF
ncbi:MAG: hypothetical protein ACFFCQ_04805 [Promethearchaeota archaeon]